MERATRPEWASRGKTNTRENTRFDPFGDHNHGQAHFQDPNSTPAGFSPAQIPSLLASSASPQIPQFARSESPSVPQNQHTPTYQSPNYPSAGNSARFAIASMSSDHEASPRAQDTAFFSVLSPPDGRFHSKVDETAAEHVLRPRDVSQYTEATFSLDDLPPSYYEELSAGAQSHGITDFNLDSIGFIAPEDLGHESRAFPPSEYPENTPALRARDSRPAPARHLSSQSGMFQSPVLPSQDSKSYNQEHLYQKQRQQRSRFSTPSMSHVTSGLHGEASFTPLVSPAVTPLESQVNSNKHVLAPVATDFEPLTSPALKAQSQAAVSVFDQVSRPAQASQAGQGTPSVHASSAFELDRRRSSAAFAPEDHAQQPQAKRRTPHSTPKLSAVSSKMKSSPALRKVSQLPSQQPPQPFDLGPGPGPTTHDTHTFYGSGSAPMAPPQGKKTHIETSSSGLGSGHSIPPTAFGPGTLMGFTMNRLVESQGSDSADSGASEAQTDRTQGLTATAAHAPASAPTSASGSVPDSSIGPQLRNVPSSAPTSGSKPAMTSSSETSPTLEAMEQGENSQGKKNRVPVKKTSHKIAEQGRRIRMNQAVHDLSSLIPSRYQDEIAVPSKATTIELAAAYIRSLHNQIDYLKNGGKAEQTEDACK